MYLNQFKECSSIVILLLCVSNLASAGKFDAKKHVSYEMYCRNNMFATRTTLYDINVLKHENLVINGAGDNRTVTGVKNCGWNWNPNRPTRLFIHGYYSDEALLQRYARAYIERDDFNFIAINWLRGARTIDYIKARHRIMEVGKAVARFVDYLTTIGLNLNELICVGHSLGAHTCGIAGKHLRSGRMAAIVALDPARPLFHLKERKERLDFTGELNQNLKKSNLLMKLAFTDAEYVQVIHTSGGYLGVQHPIGHADFYPNFGCVQPLCSSYFPCKPLHFEESHCFKY